MPRTFKTISDQNTYDLTIERFGNLNDLDEVMRKVPDLNAVSPFGYELTFSDTEDELARQFEFNNVRIATGGALVFTEEEEVCGIPLDLPDSIGGCQQVATRFPYTFPYVLS